jgi:hypothetical protein
MPAREVFGDVSPTMSNTNPPPPKPKRWPWVIGVTAVVLILASCGADHSDTSSTSSATESSSAVAAAPSISEPPPIDPNNPPVISEERDKTDLHAAWSKDADGTEHVTVTEDSGEGDAKTDTVAILKVAQQYFPNTTVAITMTGSACDNFGNCHDKDLLDLLYSATTMSRFNFSGDFFSRWSTQGQENKNRIWALADSCVPHVNNWECVR